MTKELYERAPLIVDSWPSVAALIAERPVFAHGAGLDIARLRAGFDAHGLPWPRLYYGCTLSLARAVWPAAQRGSQRLTLVALARRLFPEVRLFDGYYTKSGHDPGEDAEAAARVLLAALDATSTRTVQELLAATGRRLWAMEAERCRTSKGRAYRVLQPPSPPLAMVFDKAAQRAAYLDIRSQWRTDPVVLDVHRYPKPSDPLLPRCSAPMRNSRRR